LSRKAIPAKRVMAIRNRKAKTDLSLRTFHRFRGLSSPDASPQLNALIRAESKKDVSSEIAWRGGRAYNNLRFRFRADLKRASPSARNRSNPASSTQAERCDFVALFPLLDPAQSGSQRAGLSVHFLWASKESGQKARSLGEKVGRD
jgi:hypothetical protein